MSKEINCVNNYANTLSFTATDGNRYSRTFGPDEIAEMNDNISVIGNNICIVESFGSTIYGDNTDDALMKKIIETMNSYVENYCGNDFFCLINEDEEIEMKKVFELYSNILLINQGLLNMFSQIEIMNLNELISKLQETLMPTCSCGCDDDITKHDEIESLLIAKFREKLCNSYDEENKIGRNNK